MLKYSFFVKDKFIDVLQLFVISDFTFTSIKIIHYFNCVMKISLFPASFTKKKNISSFNITKCKTFYSDMCNFFFYSLLHIIITQFCTWSLLGLLFRAVNSNQFVLHCFFFSEVFSLNISFYPFWLFGIHFQSSLLCLLEPSFFHAFFHHFF